MAEALPFYERLLPALGFTLRFDSEKWKTFATEEPLPETAYFAVVEEPAHVPNANRIAFWVAEQGRVDELAAIVREAGASDLSGPKNMPYGSGYYAIFFADPSGNRLEVYHRPAG